MGQTVAGADCGATLTKLVIRTPAGELECRHFPSSDLGASASAIAAAAPAHLGLTGARASALAKLLPDELPVAVRVVEFDAWRVGASELLQRHQITEAGRALLVSVGTGTSVLLLDGDASYRVGGTALGGGTILGLGMALVGQTDFAELCALAQAGNRSAVDIRVADIYPPNEIPLPGDITVASFGKLALAPERAHAQTRPEDLAAGIMGLVGENLALICSGLATGAGAEHIVYAGTTLRDNPALVTVLQLVTVAMGRTATFLPEGEFAGALGALTQACEAPAPP